jgi:hypothetical protein
MSELTPAEILLQEFGVDAPNEIDLEAIALALGVEVNRAPLSGHEARIVGVGDRAIVWVDSTKSFRRQRFSIGHELGHWQLHRGSLLLCASSDIGSERALDAERMANRYAADLVMPWYLFKPLAVAAGSASWEAVAELSKLFNVSRPAAAIRLIDSGLYSAVLSCHRLNGARWFKRSPKVSDSWFVHESLDSRTSAFEVLYGSVTATARKTVNASLWFSRRDSSRFQITEQSIRSENEVYTFICIPDRDAMK